MASLVLAGIGFGALIAGAWYAQRLFDVQRTCVKRVNDERRERIAAERMVKDVQIREKIYGNVPVERLIGKDKT